MQILHLCGSSDIHELRGPLANLVSDGNKTVVKSGVGSSAIRVGQIFRVPYRGLQNKAAGFVNYQDLTRGAHPKHQPMEFLLRPF
jgi:hypothetical protein